MVCVEMIEPLALKLHIPPEYYCWALDCHSNAYSVDLHRCRRLECPLAVDSFAAMMDLNWKSYATFCIAVLEFLISNRNDQSFFHFMKYQTPTADFSVLFSEKNTKFFFLLSQKMVRSSSRIDDLCVYLLHVERLSKKTRTIATEAEVQLIEK